MMCMEKGGCNLVGTEHGRCGLPCMQKFGVAFLKL